MVASGYVWTDGSAVQGTLWNNGEPNNWGGKENCVEWNKDNGKWNDKDCYTFRNWICKISRGKW